MTINITKTAKQGRLITLHGWHVCANNKCENYVFSNWSVCLKCWIEHLASHGTDYTFLRQYKYDLQSIKAVGKLGV